jgi:monooxygenase
MDSRAFDTAVPVSDASVSSRPLLDFAAGYVLRAVDDFPKSGSRRPWRLGMSYLQDVATLRFGKLNDGSMRFSRRAADRRPGERPGTHPGARQPA